MSHATTPPSKKNIQNQEIVLNGLSGEENCYFYITWERIVNSAAEGQVKEGFFSTTQCILAF